MGKSYKTVLIVEDSPAQALALGQILEQEGVQVLWAPDGHIGVMMARQHRPDVIVLDVEMPEMNGLEACHRLKQNALTESIPIVMLTIRDEASTAVKGLDLGAVDFIPKDAFSNAVLMETLRQLGVLKYTKGEDNDDEPQ